MRFVRIGAITAGVIALWVSGNAFVASQGNVGVIAAGVAALCLGLAWLAGRHH